MKKLVLNSVLISLAMILSYVERLFPVTLIIPLPGVKIGLANIVTVFALFYLDAKSAIIINIIRCMLVSILFGSVSSFLFSIFGAAASLLVMIALMPGCGKYFSMSGISIAGAAAHNIGQIVAAFILIRSTGIFSYLTILLISSIFTGFLTSVVSSSLLTHINKIKVF